MQVTTGAQQPQPQYGYAQYPGGPGQPNVVMVQQRPQVYSQPPQEGASTALLIIALGNFAIICFRNMV